MPTIAWILGKPPHRSPVIGELVEVVRRSGVSCEIHVDDGRVPAWLGDAQLVVIRGLSVATLRGLLPLERAGQRFVDPPSRVLVTRDRIRLHDELAAAGIPTASYLAASDWDEARRAVLEHRSEVPDVVVKRRDASSGRGAGVWIGTPAQLPDVPPFDGPYVVEPRLRSVAAERKLYRLGARNATAHPHTGEVRDVLPEERGLLARVADALGLTVFGLDVVATSSGPVVVDVNAFPSCRRVPDAVGSLAGHLLRASGSSSEAPRQPVGVAR